MSIFGGILVFIVIFFLTSSLSRKFGEGFHLRMAESLVIGVVAGLVTALSPKVPAVIAVFFLIPTLALMGYIIVWWAMNGSTISELINISLIDLIVMWAGSSAAARVAGLTETGWLIGLIRCIPGVVFILSVGFFVFNMMYFKEWLDSDEFDSEKYLTGDEKLSDFKNDQSLVKTAFKKIRRWVSYEEGFTSSN